MLRGVGLRSTPAFDAPARGEIAVDEVVRGRLVGHEIRLHAALLRALHQLRQDLCGITEQADRNGLLLARVALDACQRVVEILRLLVEITRTQAEIDAAMLALDHQRTRAGKRRGERLRTAHAA